jgi:L-lactate dehydrogenase complex protein LldG
MSRKTDNPGRETVLNAVRRSLKRGTDEAKARETVEARLSGRPRGPIPARADLDAKARVDLFQEMIEEVHATVARAASLEDVPTAVSDYLKENNLPAALRLPPEGELGDLPWAEKAPLLEISKGRGEDATSVAVVCAHAAVAETGTLMLQSGPEGPTTLNFLPDTHIVVLRASLIVGNYEDAWDGVRRQLGDRVMPRTVNFVTGPSRTADIEQTIQLGAHGPRRLHVVLVEDDAVRT